MTLQRADPGEALRQPGRDELVQDVQTSWSTFRRHSDDCSECHLLAQHVREYPGKPAQILVLACCEAGRDLAARWIYACDTLTAYLNRLRVV